MSHSPAPLLLRLPFRLFYWQKSSGIKHATLIYLCENICLPRSKFARKILVLDEAVWLNTHWICISINVFFVYFECVWFPSECFCFCLVGSLFVPGIVTCLFCTHVVSTWKLDLLWPETWTISRHTVGGFSSHWMAPTKYQEVDIKHAHTHKKSQRTHVEKGSQEQLVENGVRCHYTERVSLNRVIAPVCVCVYVQIENARSQSSEIRYVRLTLNISMFGIVYRCCLHVHIGTSRNTKTLMLLASSTQLHLHELVCVCVSMWRGARERKMRKFSSYNFEQVVNCHVSARQIVNAPHKEISH